MVLRQRLAVFLKTIPLGIGPASCSAFPNQLHRLLGQRRPGTRSDSSGPSKDRTTAQNYTDIYTYEDDFAPWDDRLQVIEFREGDDFPVQTTSYEYFRLATYNTLANPNGAYFQVGEIEYFGRADGVIPPLFVGGEGTIGQRTFEGDDPTRCLVRNNREFPVGADASSLRRHGLTIDNHTIAEEVLDDYRRASPPSAHYDVVDMAGGGGTFPENLPVPQRGCGQRARVTLPYGLRPTS